MIEAVPPTVEIQVHAGCRYTSLLQTGVDIMTTVPCSIGDFLDRLPGFSKDYIINRVQTIFLNSTAVDDMETPLSGTAPVVALSAAMPGLAGAIFRRNSMHAALRSAKIPDFAAPSTQSRIIGVRLKLFNMVAAEKGEALFAAGVHCTGAGLLDFIAGHPAFLTSISRALFSGQELADSDLIKRLRTTDTIQLTIKMRGAILPAKTTTKEAHHE
ncbi:MAG: hypothetical protein P4L42_17215 [Desulfocapsaceae bacterium]|nr:hypothetical protein [Desulfocapsaceae bacterium]